MKLLLDTCTFLWMIDEVEHLSEEAKTCLEDDRNELVLNQVSSWEIQIKYQNGKLDLRCSPKALVEKRFFTTDYPDGSDRELDLFSPPCDLPAFPKSADCIVWFSVIINSSLVNS
jgi:hypothetical protein